MTYEIVPGTKAPVKVWTDPWGIEPEAARQLRDIGALPWAEGVAVMPGVDPWKPRASPGETVRRLARRVGAEAA